MDQQSHLLPEVDHMYQIQVRVAGMDQQSHLLPEVDHMYPLLVQVAGMDLHLEVERVVGMDESLQLPVNSELVEEVEEASKFVELQLVVGHNPLLVQVVGTDPELLHLELVRVEEVHILEWDLVVVDMDALPQPPVN
jgi:hypothetical protein